MTELETAVTPNLDAMARRSACGVTMPVAPGITPGSGPGHLALFGYDPLKYAIGRGVLEALGIGLELGPDDVAVRCNFCTVDADGLLTDRRAGRIPSAESAPLVEQLSEISIPGVEVIVDARAGLPLCRRLQRRCSRRRSSRYRPSACRSQPPGTGSRYRVLGVHVSIRCRVRPRGA